MLLIDGVRYYLWTPHNEEVFEKIVKEHADDIFGENSAYFDLKHKLKATNVAGIPDAYAITMEPDKLWIVEVELSTHDVFGHIMPQLGKFLAGWKKPETRESLRNALCDEIEQRSEFKHIFEPRGEIFKFISGLASKTPELVVIIDRMVPALEDVEVTLNANLTICEFSTFKSKDGEQQIHIHQYEPLDSSNANDYRTLWRNLLDGVRNRGVPVKHRVGQRSYQAISLGKAGIHLEWLTYHDALGVELHFELPDAKGNRNLLGSFEIKKAEIESKLGESVMFDHSFHKKWTRMFVQRATQDNEVPPRISEGLKHWGIETMANMYKVCKPILDDLDI